MVKYVESGTNYNHSVGYEYNAENNLTSLVETINGTDYTTSYTYDDDNRVTSMTTGGTTVEYTYDAYGRISTQVTKRGSTTILTETYTYVNPTSTTTSSQIATYKTETANYSITYTYTYDDNGNILSVNDGEYLTSYEYDSANQLIRENNQRRNRTLIWTYDNAGNILSEKTYAYTTGDITAATPTATNSYTYGDEDWGDLLTAYNGAEITYDEIGNPLSDGTRSFTWEHGRQMATQTKDGVEWEYTYNNAGLRTKRTNGSTTYEYIYSGDKLVQMIITDHTTTPETVSVVEYAYDAAGQPLTMTLGEDVYYYVLNVQGDVMGLVDGSGTLMITYYYEGYGKCFYLSDTSDKTATMSANNHLLYRSYLLDKGTGLYYLQSRYYDPARGRFLNADAYASTGQGIISNNMFAYCNNNPVRYADSSGTFCASVLGAVILATKVFYKAISYINYRNNLEADSAPAKTTKNRIINDQYGTTGKSFSYGLHDASWNACETIAVHNAKVLLNKDSSLSETMKDFQNSGAMIGDGFFGSNPLAIGRVLDSNGIHNSRVSSDEMTSYGVYIISYWTEYTTIHTVAVFFDGNEYVTYNLAGNGDTSNANPSEYASNFICGYYLGANL